MVTKNRKGKFTLDTSSASPSMHTKEITMENTTIKDVILDKKMDKYNFEERDFLAAGELTVTITLGEYRKLLKDVATAEQRIAKADEDKYSRNSENEALKKENASLKAELYELKKASEVTDGYEEKKEWKSE